MIVQLPPPEPVRGVREGVNVGSTRTVLVGTGVDEGRSPPLEDAGVDEAGCPLEDAVGLLSPCVGTGVQVGGRAEVAVLEGRAMVGSTSG